ncbi:hypothetical protein EV667_2786 [Ancylobacter aquaticus]|uniref:Uncharacterized protein n=1 Tax=Ancylobacter aquaticus TaxID=100 RepID=A0A4R1I449_ANCAQ|nr:hypothetical protein EV667_2786 [Ancylobacter aquaticus]
MERYLEHPSRLAGLAPWVDVVRVDNRPPEAPGKAQPRRMVGSVGLNAGERA